MVVAAFALLAAATDLAAAEVPVAVAANMAPVLTRLAPGFQAATGHVIRASAGATGKFHAQIAAGAPFQVLLAADDETPRRLIAEGHAVAGSAFTYAIGRLVLWSARPGLVDEQGAVLAGTPFRRLAIADPRVAPYGSAAMDVLRARGLADTLAPRLVTAQSVGQAFQFVASGNAELGFVAASQVQGAGGSLWRVPADLHRPIRQDAVLLKAGAGHPAALALLQYLKSPAVREQLRAAGYDG